MTGIVVQVHIYMYAMYSKPVLQLEQFTTVTNT